MLFKRWFLRKEVVTDISHFEVQGVYLPKELAGGELKYQNILDPRFDPKYGEGFGITQNLLGVYGI